MNCNLCNSSVSSFYVAFCLLLDLSDLLLRCGLRLVLMVVGLRFCLFRLLVCLLVVKCM